MKKTVSIIGLLALSSTAHAQPSVSIDFTLPPGVAFELGYLNHDHYFFGEYRSATLVFHDIQKTELGWLTSIGKEKKHHVGVSAGVFKEESTLFIEEKTTFLSLSAKHAYHFKGKDMSGSKIESEISWGDSEDVRFFFSLGYQFNID